MTPNQLQVLFELRSGVKQLALTDQEYLGIFGATGKPKESGQDIQGTHLEQAIWKFGYQGNQHNTSWMFFMGDHTQN